jgi:hypothetical protein
MVLAKLKLGSLDSVFLTHQHSDHNAPEQDQPRAARDGGGRLGRGARRGEAGRQGGGAAPNRAAPAQAVVVDGHTYLIDAGNGTGRQMVLAKLKLRDGGGRLGRGARRGEAGRQGGGAAQQRPSGRVAEVVGHGTSWSTGTPT